MKIKQLFLIMVLPAMFSAMFSAKAAIYGSGTFYDSRIQEIVYNTDDVTLVRIKKGTVSLVQVAPDETVTNVGLGDPLAWKVSVRENSVFFRPVSEDSPDTNVAILTDKHTYSLYLLSVTKNPTYILRYQYPKPVKSTIFSAKIPPCFDGGKINGNYEIRGDKSILPWQLWDNGEFTCMRWNSTQPLPVIYRNDADGKENIVNTHMEKNTMIIHEVSDKFTLRLGDQVAEVKTDRLIQRGYNDKGTASQQIRMEKFYDNK